MPLCVCWVSIGGISLRIATICYCCQWFDSFFIQILEAINIIFQMKKIYYMFTKFCSFLDYFKPFFSGCIRLPVRCSLVFLNHLFTANTFGFITWEILILPPYFITWKVGYIFLSPALFSVMTLILLWFPSLLLDIVIITYHSFAYNLLPPLCVLRSLVLSLSL